MKYTLVFELRRHFALQVLLIKCNIMLESQYIYLIVHWLNYNKHASSVASYYFYVYIFIMRRKSPLISTLKPTDQGKVLLERLGIKYYHF